MRKHTYLFVSLLIFFAVSVFGVSIEPTGKKVALDKQGNAIYQVEENGIKIGYKLIGSGEPLVLIMGLDGTMNSWPPEFINALSKKYQLILMDNRGMGYSTANGTEFTYKLFADDVISLLDALKVNKANVLGFSMGSTITQELLFEYSQRLNKAIIYATSTDGSNVADVLKKSKSEELEKDPIIQRQIEATVHWKTPLEKLPLITNQVMLVVGTSDTVVGIESSKIIASAIPGAWLIQFKGATHLLVYESPDELARIVLVFLEMNETVKSI